MGKRPSCGLSCCETRKRGGRRFSFSPTAAPTPPRVVLPKYKTVVLVHGCFWHRHRKCKNCTNPTNRRDGWLAKLEGNAARDRVSRRALRKLGWKVLVVWECETERADFAGRLENRLAKAMTPRG